jgi:hypothetical protein
MRRLTGDRPDFAGGPFGPAQPGIHCPSKPAGQAAPHQAFGMDADFAIAGRGIGIAQHACLLCRRSFVRFDDLSPFRTGDIRAGKRSFAKLF